ncbi:4Fe-4S binding protein [Azospirillum sp. ST 5-10]|uniref:4Fe-4S binding protein n=1 Tax=unclassified Azospirillum TaxID=2630922 RepID=UPI003F4A7215
MLLDLDGQRLYLFGIDLWPRHIHHLTGVMILAAVGLFLATALAGRVWCGYACPRTVWTDLFVLVEESIEGDRGARIRLDAGPRTAAWVLKKTAKHAVWMAIAAVTGGTAVLHFIDSHGFLADLGRLEASTPVLWCALTRPATAASPARRRGRPEGWSGSWPPSETRRLP